MSLFHSEKNNPQKAQNSYILGLFFAILAILVLFSIYLVRSQHISQNLTINYYLEIDLKKFNQDSGIWLKNNPKRQKILDFWNYYFEKQVPKPPKSLFNGKISLINISVPIEEEGEQALTRLQEKEDEIIFIADVQNQQIAKNYLRKLGSLKKSSEQGIDILTLNKPIFGQNKAYYNLDNNQLIISSGIEALNLAKSSKNKINFPSQNPINTFSVDNDFLKFYAKPGKISFLASLFPIQSQPFWFSAEINPDNLIVNFNGNPPKTQTLSLSWLEFLPESNYLAIFSQNLPDILNIQYFSDARDKWQNTYNFNFKKDIYPLLENNQSLLLLVPKSSNYTLNWQDYYFCLVINKSAFSPDSPEIAKIEKIAQNVFSKEFPSEETIILPDNSTVTELISKPEIFQFQTKELANFSQKYLQKPNFEFVYTFFADKIVFSNSINLLEQIFVKNISHPAGPLFECLDSESIPADLIYLNPDSGLEEYGFKNAVFTSDKACIY